MRLEIASKEAIDYSCRNYHYAKKVPVVQSAFSVFNDKKKWCGTICYGSGASPQIAKHFDMRLGEVVELVRVALNGKQGKGKTSKAVAISLRLLKKYNPLVRLVVSYADSNQGHKGTIYQATNWYFEGMSAAVPKWKYKDKTFHNKTISVRGYGTYNGEKIPKERLTKWIEKPKIKYIYPLDKSLRPMCEEMHKEYIKDASVV